MATIVEEFGYEANSMPVPRGGGSNRGLGGGGWKPLPHPSSPPPHTDKGGHERG